MIRSPTPNDVLSIKAIIEANQLFPPDMVDGMIQPFFDSLVVDTNDNDNIDNADDGDELWFIDVDDSVVAADTDADAKEASPAVRAVLYCGPERMTGGNTYNAWLLAVHPSNHRKGSGRRLMEHLEKSLLLKLQHRQRDDDQNNHNNNSIILLVETAGTDDYETARAFYKAIGFVEEARIREFYGPGEDKVVYWKRLSLCV